MAFAQVTITFTLKYGGAMVKTMAVSAQSCILVILDWTMFDAPFSVQSLAGVITVQQCANTQHALKVA